MGIWFKIVSMIVYIKVGCIPSNRQGWKADLDAMYVGESQSVVVTVGTASAIELVASYEEISDT